MRVASVVLFLFAMALSGCVSEDAPTGPRVVDDLDIEALVASLLVQDHDHDTAHDDHVGTYGMQPLSFTPARAGAYPDEEVYFEMAVKAGHAFVAYGPHAGYLKPGQDAGFIVYDVAVPEAPKEVGRWHGQPPSDIEVSDDGDWVFVTTQRNGYPYPYTVHADAIGDLGVLPRGTYVVDARDKSDPKTVSFTPLPTNGPHTITWFETPDGRELVFHSTYDFVFTTYPDNLGQNSASQKVVIMEVERSGPVPILKPLSTFQILKPDEEGLNFFPHDATAYVDPTTERVIMTVAYWDLGMVLVDITDPTMPKELSRFADTGPSDYTKTHLVRVFPGTLDGRMVAVMEPEIPGGSDDGQYTFVDVTDPAKPAKLGHWSLPGEHVIDKPFVFSPHNFDLACGGDGVVSGVAVDWGAPCQDPTVVLGHFHGGLWTLDASDPTAPRASGYFFPLVERQNIVQGFPWTGFVTAYMADGRVYAPEAWTGLYVLSADAPVETATLSVDLP